MWIAYCGYGFSKWSGRERMLIAQQEVLEVVLSVPEDERLPGPHT